MRPMSHRLQQYDPQRDITAQALRRLGFYLDERLPDEAFVRRVAVGIDSAEDWEDGGVTVRLAVLETFVTPSCVAAWFVG